MLIDPWNAFQAEQYGPNAVSVHSSPGGMRATQSTTGSGNVCASTSEECAGDGYEGERTFDFDKPCGLYRCFVFFPECIPTTSLAITFTFLSILPKAFKLNGGKGFVVKEYAETSRSSLSTRPPPFRRGWCSFDGPHNCRSVVSYSGFVIQDKDARSPMPMPRWLTVIGEL